jgi:hypothetical protein
MGWCLIKRVFVAWYLVNHRNKFPFTVTCSLFWACLPRYCREMNPGRPVRSLVSTTTEMSRLQREMAKSRLFWQPKMNRCFHATELVLGGKHQRRRPESQTETLVFHSETVCFQLSLPDLRDILNKTGLMLRDMASWLRKIPGFEGWREVRDVICQVSLTGWKK